MADFRNGAADSNVEHRTSNKVPKSAVSNECCHAALDTNLYAAELLEMRKGVEKHGGSINEADEVVRLKFLLDSSLKPKKASKMFVKYQEWRASYIPLGYIPNSEVSNLLAREIIAMPGKSKKGYPVIVAFSGGLQENKPDVETIKRFFVYIMDKSLASAAEVGSVIVIVDMKRICLKDMDFRYFLLGCQLQQKYYPGMLHKMYCVNLPKFVTTGFKIVMPLLPKAAKEKIVILEGHEMTDALLSEMDAEVLPKMYGGKGETVWLQDVRVPNWGPPGE